MTLLLFGYGFLGRAVARHARGQALNVVATVRNADELAAIGGAAVALEDAEALAASVSSAEAILITAPPGEKGCPGLTSLEPLLTRATRWIGYLSTTGVYGDRGGRWVFEETPLASASAEGSRRAAAEIAWSRAGAAVGASVQIFRLPGLYGPGRSAFDRLRDGSARRIVRRGQLFSRLHVDDGAAAIIAALQRPTPLGVYNLCDDEPAPNADVIAHAARLAGLPVPALEDFDSAELSPASRRFYGESKRVSNARAKAALGWRPKYPTYREGLAAILSGGG